ncbi:leucine-rich repeat extensin-like protein 5 [Triticum dicoccoides]|uniref:leucine-rich repeat extensin-like protein 5 n=1 Tax=Triticum dicoccoides TaxID=85692 RepID=UPI00189032D1|nr:leucine-rich repeat extensin-like protein 5 [Triticum dicoccoides]
MALPPPPRSAPGILGARPPQAHAAFSGPLQQQQYSFYPAFPMPLHQPPAFHHQPYLPAPPQQQQYNPPPASSDAHGVDHAALMGALHNLSLQSPSGGWVADSGASTHLVTDPGLCNQGGNSSVQQ